MGRKSLQKKRKKKNKKVKKWTQELLPKLRTRALNTLTMDDLAGLMGKSKSTLYEYFETKEEIFEYITQVRIDELRTYKDEISFDTRSFSIPYQRLAEIFSEKTKDISSFYLSELKVHYPSAWNMVTRFLEELLEDLRQLYIVGMKHHIFRNISPDLLIKLDEYFVIKLLTDYQFQKSTGQTLDMVIKNYLILKFEGLKLHSDFL